MAAVSTPHRRSRGEQVAAQSAVATSCFETALAVVAVEATLTGCASGRCARGYSKRIRQFHSGLIITNRPSSPAYRCENLSLPNFIFSRTARLKYRWQPTFGTIS